MASEQATRSSQEQLATFEATVRRRLNLKVSEQLDLMKVQLDKWNGYTMAQKTDALRLWVPFEMWVFDGLCSFCFSPKVHAFAMQFWPMLV